MNGFKKKVLSGNFVGQRCFVRLERLEEMDLGHFVSWFRVLEGELAGREFAEPISLLGPGAARGHAWMRALMEACRRAEPGRFGSYTLRHPKQLEGCEFPAVIGLEEAAGGVHRLVLLGVVALVGRKTAGLEDEIPLFSLPRAEKKREVTQ